MTADLRQIVEGVLLVFAALFPIVNPLGGAPIFLAMTSDYVQEERASLAWRVTVNAFVLLVASVATGTYVLEDGAGARTRERSTSHQPQLRDAGATSRSTR